MMPALLCLLWKETWVKKELLVLKRIWESAMQKSSPSNTLPIKIDFPSPRAVETHDLSWNWAVGSTSPVRYKVVISVPKDQLQAMVRLCEVWGRWDRLDFPENCDSGSCWLKSWKDKAHRSLEFKVAAPLEALPWLLGLARSCSGLQPQFPCAVELPQETLSLWAWVSQVRSHSVHPLLLQRGTVGNLVVSVHSSKLCEYAAHSHWAFIGLGEVHSP